MFALTTVVTGLALAGVTAPPQGAKEYEKDLLALGAKVPDLKLSTPAGKEIKFSEVFKTNKATVLNFWFFH